MEACRTYECDGSEVMIGAGLLSEAGRRLNLNRKVLVVTDSGVPAEYAEKIASFCTEPYIVTIPEGEGSKSFSNLQLLLSEMLKASFTRNDCAVAVGGGVCGDLTGFAASVYMRGIEYYNVPTTLLSQVDSSVGGKTAIDFEGVKNIVGSFYPPKKVLIDPEVLRTLSPRQKAAGLAEAIKIAVSRDEKMFISLEELGSLDCDLTEIINGAVYNKLVVVREDPTEKGLRRVLNFGHTIGHAIEAYKENELLHGECVALGTLAMCSPEVKARLIPIYERFSLPVKTDVRPEDILFFLKRDKKAQGKGVKAVFVENAGSCSVVDMSFEDILGRMEEIL
ncbi:MAG: 3-dehydroquinate synthase [Oscillospiraceae bacterium]|nr:3-dehydroquinate synthase [Oscillospiraceae bacterium]